MKKIAAALLALSLCSFVLAGPVLEMNRAFRALTDLIPFLTQKEKFVEKKNEKQIKSKITELQAAFKSAKHNTLLKEDLFAPSYQVINESIDSSLSAFNQGKKDYAHWRLKEITTHCLDCHTRLPPSHTSSFQNGELIIDARKFDSVYNLGIAQVIVRRYSDAKMSLIRVIQDQEIKKDYKDIALPFKLLLVIDTKVLKNPEDLISIFTQYSEKKQMPEEIKESLKQWVGRLNHWKGNKVLASGIHSDKEIDTFIKDELIPLKKISSLEDKNDVDLLMASGLLSNYLFENQKSKRAPEISYWLGWVEKNLKRDEFFGSGDLFLKQCIKRYPKDPMAKKCLEEYKESIEFEFSGSSGTHIPQDINKELQELQELIGK